MLPVLLSLLSVVLVLAGLVALQRQQAARPGRAHAVRLLEKVLAGEARDADWLVFMGTPVRHDPVLVEVRLRCLAIEEKHYTGEGSWRGPHLFTRAGLAELEQLLRWLQRQADARLM